MFRKVKRFKLSNSMADSRGSRLWEISLGHGNVVSWTDIGLLTKRSVTSLFFFFFWESWLDIQDGIRCLGMWRRAWQIVNHKPVLKASINQWEFGKGYLWMYSLCLHVRCRLHQAPISPAISQARTVGPFSRWGDWGQWPWRHWPLPSVSSSAFLPELFCLNKYFRS